MFLGRVVPAGESAWSYEDQDRAIAAWRFARECCSRCGSTDREWAVWAKTTLREDRPYEAKIVRCHGCAELDREQRQVTDWKEPGERDGVRTVLVPFDPDAPIPVPGEDAEPEGES